MPELMGLVKSRQKSSGLSVERYANKIGITAGAMYHYLNGTRESVSLSSIRKMATFYHGINDTEMLQALAQYALGLETIPS